MLARGLSSLPAERAGPVRRERQRLPGRGQAVPGRAGPIRRAGPGKAHRRAGEGIRCRTVLPTAGGVGQDSGSRAAVLPAVLVPREARSPSPWPRRCRAQSRHPQGLLAPGAQHGMVTALLDSCDPTRRGRRDFAVLTLLARLGLRGGEVAPSTDDRLASGRDRHPRQGQPPGPASSPCRRRRGPRGLPRDGRPAWQLRALFLRVRAPIGELSPKRWGGSSQRRGAGWGGPGRPPAAPQRRHGHAPAGASLSEVGQVLRQADVPPQRSTPRSTRSRCALWPGLGPGGRHDRAAPGGRRLPGRAPFPRFQADGLRPLLADFVAYLEHRRHDGHHRAGPGLGHPASDATSPGMGKRLGVVRGFAAHLHAFDPATEVPPAGCCRLGCRAVPYLYSDAEVATLMPRLGRCSRRFVPQPTRP